MFEEQAKRERFGFIQSMLVRNMKEGFLLLRFLAKLHLGLELGEWCLIEI